MLIIPFEFSHCLQIQNRSTDSRAIQLFRADLLLTAVEFEGKLDATIAYRAGPFSGSSCRLHDARDMADIEIAGAFARRPELLPTGMAY